MSGTEQDIPVWLQPVQQAAEEGAMRSQLSKWAQQDPPTHVDGRPIRPSAVLIAIKGSADYKPTTTQPFPPDAQLLLTHRAVGLSSHSGQIAFPGGRKDASDPNLVHTALREAQEETGLDPQCVTVMAQHSPIYIDRTQNVVTPILAWWHTDCPVRVQDPGEVAQVLEVPLTHLCDPAQRFRVGLAGWAGPAFSLGRLLMWGFTGGVVDALVRAAGWEMEWQRDPVRDLATVLEQSANNEPTHLWRINDHGSAESAKSAEEAEERG